MGLVTGKCPNCGANLKISENATGELTCPFCGSVYLVENAVNIVNNNVVNNNFIQANELVVNSGNEAFYIQLMNDAMECKDWEGVVDNSLKILALNPNNLRASLLSGIGTAYLSSVSKTKSQLKTNKVFGAYQKIFIKNNASISNEEICEYLCYYNDFLELLMRMAEKAYDPDWSNEESVYMVWGVYLDCVAAYKVLVEICEKYALSETKKGKDTYILILKKYSEALCEISSCRFYNTHITGGKIDEQKLFIDDVDEYKKLLEDNDDKILKFDPSYIRKKPATHGGCYIATCVYRSYDCPEVWTLRRYRDNILAKNWYGRVFIHIYYAISPTMVRLFGKKDWFRNFWQKKLDKKVEKLQSNGVENTPYQDKEW